MRKLFLYCFFVCIAATFVIFCFSSLETSAKIIMTAVSLSAYSLTGLSCIIISERRQYRSFGQCGVAAAIAGALFAILTNWQIVTGWEIVIKGRLFFLVLAFAFCHSALLLMIKVNNNLVRLVRNITLGIIVLVAMTLLYVVLFPNGDSIAWAWLIGSTFGILDIIGTIATPLLHLMTRESKTQLIAKETVRNRGGTGQSLNRAV